MITAYRPEDTTKPSRLNRRRKKRWRKTGLTNYALSAKLFSLSQKTKDGIGVPNSSRRKPRHAVFLCVMLKHVFMSGWAGQSQDWPVPRSRYANLVQSGSHDWRHVCRVYKYFSESIMTNHAQNPAKSSQTKQSRFNLIKRTPEGQRLICQDLTFVQAVVLVAEIPAAIVKFSRMVGVAQ
jgi:hypothetical protein